MKKSSDFYTRVYFVAQQIPRGKVTSYGAIAEYIGLKSSARLVGYAMNACHNSNLGIPAHRVVNRKGLLTGKHHFPSPTLMQKLLEAEGLIIENNQIQNLESYFWNPLELENSKSIFDKHPQL